MLQKIADGGPRQRVGLIPDRGRLTWRFDPFIDSRYVLHDVAIDRADPARTIGALMSRPLEAPIGAYADNGYLVIGIDHGIGDAHVIFEIIAALSGEVEDSSGFRSPPGVTEQPVGLPRAFLSAFRETPRGVAREVGALCGSAARAVIRHIADEDTTERHRRRAEPHDLETSYSIALTSARSEAGFVDELRQWRDSQMSSTSISALLFYAVWQGMLEAGIDLFHEVEFLVDLRRYLRAGQGTLGNLASVATVDVTSADGSAVQFGELLGEELRTHRALIRGGLAGVIRRLCLQRRLRGVSDLRDSSQPRLMFSEVSKVPEAKKVAWAKPSDESTFVVALPPGSAQRISVAVFALDGVVHLSASYCPDIVDGDLVRRGLELALTAAGRGGEAR
ncbi:hypothetical protein [Gordonia sp. NPDC003376]